MSDQHPEHGIPPVGEPPQDLAPPPAEVPPRKERAKVRLTAMAGLLVVAAVGFGIVQLAQGDGASSAEDAVEELFEAVDRQDPIGAAEALEPSERKIVIDALEQAKSEASRVKLTDDDLDLHGVEGVDLSVDGLEMEATALDEDTYAVDLTAGRISSRSELAKMPIGPVIEEVIDRNEEAGERVDATSTDEIELAGTRLVAVKRSGEWYVSALYSLAEQIRSDMNPVPAYPEPGSGIAAVGADSPEAAVREGVAAATRADLRRLIELTPEDEARVLHTYGPILVAEAQGEDTGTTVEDLELKVSDAPDGRKLVRATSMTMTVDTEYDRQVTTYDGTCTTTTWTYTDEYAEEYEDEGLQTDNEWKQCDDDITTLSPFGFLNVWYSPGSLDVIVEEHDGKWFLSPTSTVVQNTVGSLAGFDVDDVRRLARSWGGEWWLYESPELWEACGVAQPTLDDSRTDAEAAYDECIASLPDDYTGPWGPMGSTGSIEGGSMSFPGDECYGTASKTPSTEEIDACLAGLVASGELDPSDLADFRCSKVFDSVPMGDDVSEDEYSDLWDEAQAEYEACMEAVEAGEGGSGGNTTFGSGGTTATTQPDPGPSTTRPPATTTTTGPATSTTRPAPTTTSQPEG